MIKEQLFYKYQINTRNKYLLMVVFNSLRAPTREELNAAI